MTAEPRGRTLTARVSHMQHVTCVSLCAIGICGCGASTAGKSRAAQTSTAQPPIVRGVVSGPPALSIGPPPSVRRAGGRQLAEFNLGRAVVEQSGCLACHRIGGQGTGEPGPALTYIGSMMPQRSIEQVLIDAEPPMPSFSHLPRTKFKALVRFLTLLRCPGSAGLLPHGCRR
jgi:mono/diheme cytochrome c family protein